MSTPSDERDHILERLSALDVGGEAKEASVDSGDKSAHDLADDLDQIAKHAEAGMLAKGDGTSPPADDTIPSGEEAKTDNETSGVASGASAQNDNETSGVASGEEALDDTPDKEQVDPDGAPKKQPKGSASPNGTGGESSNPQDVSKKEAGSKEDLPPEMREQAEAAEEEGEVPDRDVESGENDKSDDDSEEKSDEEDSDDDSEDEMPEEVKKKLSKSAEALETDILEAKIAEAAVNSSLTSGSAEDNPFL